MAAFIILFLLTSFEQDDSKNLIKNFIDDVQSDQLQDSVLMKKYFVFSPTISEGDKKSEILPVLTIQFNFIRQNLSKECPDFKIIKHDSTLGLIQSYMLKIKPEHINSVFYLTCNDKIVLPILLHKNGNKISSIIVHSKHEGAAKVFMIL